MAVTITHSVTNVIGADSVSGDLANQLEDQTYVLPTFYGSEDFAFTVNFFATEDEGNGVASVTGVTHTATSSANTEFIEATSSTNSVAFTKNFTPFEEYWDFRVAENDNRRLLPQQARELEEGFDTIISWNQPAEKTISVNHQFTVAYSLDIGGDGSDVINFVQYYYWNYVPSLAEFQQLVEEGKL